MEVFYKKEGRKYVPVSYYDDTLLKALPEGATLVVVDGNATMWRKTVEPANLPVLAALTLYANVLVDTMCEVSIDADHVVSDECIADLREVMLKHNGPESLSFKSKWGMVHTATLKFEEIVTSKFSCPVVQDAYDTFMTIYKLTHSEDNGADI